MNPIRLFYIITKEYLKKPMSYIIILIIPAIIFLINTDNNGNNNSPITIGYCIDGKDYSKGLIEKTLDEYEGLFNFVKYNKEKDLIKDVTNNKLECGYLINGDILNLSLEGERDESITVYKSNKTTMDAIINETVFAQLFPVFSEQKLEEYITNKSDVKEFFDEGLFTTRDIKKSYDEYFTNGSTFHFEYEDAPTLYENLSSSLLLSPLKSIIGLMIMISSLTGAYSFYSTSISLRKNISIRFVYIFVPTLLSLISSVFSITIMHEKITDKNLIYCILMLILYSIVCSLLTLLITLFIKNQNLFASVIPIMVLGTIIFTPFIIDFSIFLPFIKYVSYLFPPYYLNILL